MIKKKKNNSSGLYLNLSMSDDEKYGENEVNKQLLCMNDEFFVIIYNISLMMTGNLYV